MAVFYPDTGGPPDDWTVVGAGSVSAALASDDGDTSYLLSAVNDFQGMGYTRNVPAGSTGITVTIWARAKYVATSGSLALTLMNEVDVFGGGSTHALTASYATYSDVYTDNPWTVAAWTVDQVNGVIGADRLAKGILAQSGANACRVTESWLEITFTPPAGGALGWLPGQTTQGAPRVQMIASGYAPPAQGG
jgi:hypothetical protein